MRGREWLEVHATRGLTRRNNLGGMAAEDQSGTKEAMLDQGQDSWVCFSLVLPLNSQGTVKKLFYFSDFVSLSVKWQS